MWLQTRMYLLVAAMFAILYAIMVMVASAMGVGGFISYAVLALVIVFFQYLIGPSLVGLTMRVKWVSEQEEPELHRMVAELAREAHIPKPKVGISLIPIPNAFAYGRSQGSARVVVTEAIRGLLSRDELRAVVGHEISHVKNRDMAIITLLSVVPMILWYIAWSTMFSRGIGGRGDRRDGGYIALIGLAAFLSYFIANLLVLYASRIREYYADRGSVRLGNRPRHMATALYKLVYGNARVSPEALKQAQGVRAFFVNDPSRARWEISELKQIDQDMSGTIDETELASIRSRPVKLGFGDKLMETFSTHPNMVKRIHHLSTLD
ncbi:MAG: zinc metalloprotease HtpX [Chloroflexota bacterium]